MDSPDSTTTATHNLIPARRAAADIVFNDICSAKPTPSRPRPISRWRPPPAAPTAASGKDSTAGAARGYDALPAAAVAVAAFLAARAQTSSAGHALAFGRRHRLLPPPAQPAQPDRQPGRQAGARRPGPPAPRRQPAPGEGSFPRRPRRHQSHRLPAAHRPRRPPRKRGATPATAASSTLRSARSCGTRCCAVPKRPA